MATQFHEYAGSKPVNIALVKTLQELSGLVVKRQNQMSDMPKYPYITYTPTTHPGNTDIWKRSYTLSKYNAEKKVFELVYERDVDTVFSITVRGEDPSYTEQMANYLHAFFDSEMDNYILDDECKAAVIEVRDTGDRSTTLSSTVECANGFDVVIRWADIFVREVESIETAPLEWAGKGA